MRMEKQLPSASDFPSTLNLSVIPPPNGQPATNILILLHGLGDTHLPFAKLGTQLNLPNTACIAITAPSALPFEEGSFHWCDDVIFDSSANTLDPDGGFKATTKLLHDRVMTEVLIGKCNYKPRDILFLGLGQGGIAALNAAVLYPKELGGVISIGGSLPGEAPSSSEPKSKTPIIICYGEESRSITAGAQEKLRYNFEYVKLSRYGRPGDTMPQNRDEMLPVMQFLASRLRTPAPKGTVEIS